MSQFWRRATVWIASAGLGVAALLTAQPAASQTGTVMFPTWMSDSSVVSNTYIYLWQYFRNNDVTRWNLWTQSGDPLNGADDFTYFIDPAQTTNTVIVWPWGSRLISGQRPNPRSGNGGDDRPYAAHFTLHVEDTGGTNGFSNYELPEDGRTLFSPPSATLPAFQGFFSQYEFPNNAPSTSGVDLEVQQKVEFARDLVKIEIAVKNNGSSARRVGGRMALDPYVDNWGNCRSVFIPKTRERIFYEKQFDAAQVPDEWVMFDFDEGSIPPNFIAKGILRGNGATSPNRLIVTNMIDVFPFVEANGTYDWVTRPNWELRISDIGFLLYWDPISIPAGQSRSFITYAGLGVADHAMSDTYRSTPSGQLQPQGFVSSVQTPFAMPLRGGDADVDEVLVSGYLQNENSIGVPGSFGFIELADGLELGVSQGNQSPQLSLGGLSRVGDPGDERVGNWTVKANGVQAGLLAVNVTFGNQFGDSSRVQRFINVPQGRRYQLGQNWRMLTFPFTYTNDDDDPARVLGLTPGTFQIVRYNPQVNSYEPVTRVRPGESYWIKTQGSGDTFVRLVGANAIDLRTGDVAITGISGGWNQVGNPSPYVVPVRDLRLVLQGGGIVTFDQAVAANYIRGTLYEHNRLTGEYIALNRDSLIQPGRGVWVFANGDRSLLWPAPEGPGRNIIP